MGEGRLGRRPLPRRKTGLWDIPHETSHLCLLPVKDLRVTGPKCRVETVNDPLGLVQ